MTWDVTVPDTLAASYRNQTSVCGGAAAEKASLRKMAKYSCLLPTHDFCPIACETMGPINEAGLSLLADLGSRLTSVTGDPQEHSFLLQRVSVVNQRCNAVAFPGLFVTDIFTNE